MEASTISEMKPPQDGHRALISAFPNGVLVLFDSDLRYRIVGPDVLPFSEREASEMVGKTVHELFPEETATELEPELRATLDGDSRSFDVSYSERTHHIETRPVAIDDEPFGVLVTQEVTDERETTAELAEKTRRLETVANVLSHDLRTPLSIAFGHLELIAEDSDVPHDSIASIRRALTRMDTIMTDGLVLARETTLSDTEPVDIEQQVKTAWEMIPTEEATLRTEGPIRVMADTSLLGNLFENLIRNAVSHGGSDVTVQVGPLDDRSGFYVADDGPGVPSAIRDTALDAGVTTGNDEDHSGLGLAIVAEIVDAHGWNVTLTDAASGGARFEFTGVTGAE